jgi:hypothetical protein
MSMRVAGNLLSGQIKSSEIFKIIARQSQA